MNFRDLAVACVRRHLLGAESQLVFEHTDQPPVIGPGPLPLYLHVPFCRSVCRFCPYCKVRYDAELLGRYMQAVDREIDLHADACGRRLVPSLYIGGGTPTLADHLLARTIEHLRNRFDLAGPIAIETTPAECTDAKLAMLRAAGVTMLSIGVQSFHDELLRSLGRPYRADAIGPAIGRAVNAGFETVNLDLMFALPGQSDGQLQHDLQTAIAAGVNHLTFYPLFQFPHTQRRRRSPMRGVRMPRLWTRWRQFRMIERHMRDSGFEPVSVWSFRRGPGPRYSSVTRPHYLGLGVSSISHCSGAFTANTFDFDQYIALLQTGRPATTWRMTCSPAMERYHRLYWRLYETVVPMDEVRQCTQAGDHRPRRWLEAARRLGLTRRQPHGYVLTRRGAFWIHLMQNHFALDSIDRLWGAARSANTPQSIAV